MAMSLTFQRPFIAADRWYQRINYRWFVVRSPQVVLGIESAYGVGGFIYLGSNNPLVAVIGSVAFDLIFLAMIALADQQLTDDAGSTVWYFVLNVGAAAIAGLFGTLFYAGGTYAAVTAESITHGAIFPLFGLLYSFYYHRQMKPIILREAAEALEAAEQSKKADAERAAFEAANPYICPYCEERRPSVKARNGHMARCAKRPAAIP